MLFRSAIADLFNQQDASFNHESPHGIDRMQAWTYSMDWYAEQRQRLEDEIQKYSDPPSEHMLPELPPHAQ